MSETAKKYRKLTAADILKADHQLHKSFVNFCGENPPTKRQAKKFLQQYPVYRDIEVEIA